MGRSNNSSNRGNGANGGDKNRKHSDPSDGKQQPPLDGGSNPINTLLSALSTKAAVVPSTGAVVPQQQQNIPLWKNTAVHVWKKDSITVINFRDESEILPALEKVSSALPPQKLKKPLETVPIISSRGAVAAAEMPKEGAPKSVQSFLDSTLAYMREHERRPQSMTAPPPPPPPPPAPVQNSSPPPPPPKGADPFSFLLPSSSSQHEPVALFSDPLWGIGGSWGASDNSSLHLSKSMPSDEPEVDLSELLGDFKQRAQEHSGPAPIASSAASAAASSVGAPQPAGSTPVKEGGGPASAWAVAAGGASWEVSSQNAATAPQQQPAPQGSPSLQQQQPPQGVQQQMQQLQPGQVAQLLQQGKIAYAMPAPGGGFVPVQQVFNGGFQAIPHGAQQIQVMPQQVQFLQAAPAAQFMNLAGKAGPGMMINYAGAQQAKPIQINGMQVVSLEEYQRQMMQQQQQSIQYVTPQQLLQAQMKGIPIQNVQLLQPQQMAQLASPAMQQQIQQLQQAQQAQAQQQQAQQQQQQQQVAAAQQAAAASRAQPTSASALGVNVSAPPFVPKTAA